MMATLRTNGISNPIKITTRSRARGSGPAGLVIGGPLFHSSILQASINNSQPSRLGYYAMYDSIQDHGLHIL